MCYTCNCWFSEKKGFHLSFAIFFSYLLFFHLVVEVCHSLHPPSKERAFLICKLRMRRMLENDTETSEILHPQSCDWGGHRALAV